MLTALAQDIVSHERVELYAVIGALVAVIAYQERQRVRLIGIVAKFTKDDEENE